MTSASTVEALRDCFPAEDPTDRDMLNNTARHLFLTNISLYFHDCGYPLTSLRIIRTRTLRREAGTKSRDSCSAVIIALAPDRRSGFRVLMEGPVCTGEIQVINNLAIRELRDELEEAMREKVEEAKAEQAYIENTAGAASANGPPSYEVAQGLRKGR